MEVKDVNNSLSQLLFNKNIASASATEALGSGFASLLGQTGNMIMDMLPSGSEANVKVGVGQAKTADNSKKDTASKTPAAVDKSKNDKTAAIKDDKKIVKADTADKKASADKVQNKKTKAVADEVNIAAPAQTQVPAVQQIAEDAVPAAAVVETAVAESTLSLDGEAVVTAVGEEAITPLADGLAVNVPEISAEAPQMPTAGTQPIVSQQELVNNSDLQIIIDGQAVELADFAINPEDLKNLGAIQVFDPESGDVFQTTGAELYQKLQQQVQVMNNAASETVLNVDSQTMAPVMKNPVEAAENLVSAQATQPAVDNAKSNEAQKELGDVKTFAKVKSAQAAASTVVYHDDKLAEQAVALDEVIPEGQNLKVNVNVKEEKFAYTASTSDLLKDKITLEDALNASVADEAVSEASNNANVQTANISQNNVNAHSAVNNKLNSMLGVAPVMNSAVAAEAAETVAAGNSVAAVTEIGSSSLSHAVAGNSSEFVTNAKAEAAKGSDTSFKDIYKGMSKEIADQVKVNITKSAVKGVDKIDIQLKPEDLGHIEIKMQIEKDGKLKAHIISSRPETMEILQKEVQNLEKAFNEAGFQTDDGSLSFSFREGNQTGQDGEKNSELRSFIGNVFESEAQEEFAGNDNLNWSPDKGLNIRV